MNNIFRKKLFFYSIFFTLILLLILITGEYSRDIDSYRELHYHSTYYGSFEIIKDQFYYEYLFKFIFYQLSQFLNFNELFFLIGFLLLFLKVNIFWKNYDSFVSACLMYVFLQLLSMHEASQLRTAVITLFLLYGISSKNTNFFYNLFITIISVTFHKIGFIYIILNSIRLFLLSCILLLLLIIFQDFLIMQIYNLNLYDFTEYLSVRSYAEFHALPVENIQNRVSYTNSILWSQVFISILSILNFKNLDLQQKKSFYLIFFCSLSYFVFVNTPNIASRMVEISLIALIPLFCASKFKWNLFWYGKLFLLGYIMMYQTMLYAELFSTNLSK